MSRCQYTLLPCPKKCRDDNRFIMRKNLEDHLKKCSSRHHMCERCGEEGTYETITTVHDSTCKKRIVSCTNTECSQTMQRQDVNHHVQAECDHTMVTCKHKSIGCDVKLKRKDMLAHELDDELHLYMGISTIAALKEKNDTLEETVAALKKEVSVLIMDVSTLKWNVFAPKQNVKEEVSPSKLDVSTPKQNDSSLEDSSDIILKQGETLTFRFTGYQARKESQEIFTSSYFYTSQGYRMAIKLFPYGQKDGKGTHLSVHVTIKEGKYDAQLKWPLTGSVTITLLNQLKDTNHRELTLGLNNECNARVGASWGYPKFIAHSALNHDPVKDTQYLKDDTLYFRVGVKVDGHKPWLDCTANIY